MGKKKTDYSTKDNTFGLYFFFQLKVFIAIKIYYVQRISVI